jgi:hypothetical protein
MARERYAAAARRRLGQLIGGEEGADLEARAANALRAMGAVDIEATTRMFTFGIEVRWPQTQRGSARKSQ